MEKHHLYLAKKISILVLLFSLSAAILYLQVPAPVKWICLGTFFVVVVTGFVKRRTAPMDEREIYIAYVSTLLAGNTAISALALYITRNNLLHLHTDHRLYLLLAVWGLSVGGIYSWLKYRG